MMHQVVENCRQPQQQGAGKNHLQEAGHLLKQNTNSIIHCYNYFRKWFVMIL